MARTAAFGADNMLIAVYASGKEAKTALKGQKDIVFVTESTFDEATKENSLMDPDGVILSKETLFPAPERKAAAPKAEGEEGGEPAERKPRVRHVLEGPYHVVKDNGARFAVDDERGALHEALIKNTTCEDYFAAAPEKVKFVSSRGAEQTCTAAVYFGYAIKRGWVKLGEPSDDTEQADQGETEQAQADRRSAEDRRSHEEEQQPA